MKKSKYNLFREKRVRFIIVGVIGATVELILFSKFMSSDLGVSISNFLAFHFAFVLCFFLHYLYTHQKPYVGTRMIINGLIKYTGLMYAQLFVGTILLWVLIDKFGWVAEYAKFMQICVVTPISYVIQRHAIFRKGAI